jgi:hypothetical protein
MRVNGPQGDVEFRSLYRWLQRQEGERLRQAGITMSEPGSPPEHDEMGGAFEVVKFVFETVAQYGALAVAIAAWRRNHAPRSAVVFEREGVRISLDQARLLEEAAVRQALRELLDVPEESDGDAA